METVRETLPPRRRSIVNRHPWLAALVVLAAAAALAVPVAAYVIVPALNRSTLNESLPVASAPVGAARAPATSTHVLAQGELRRLNAVDFGSGKVLVTDVNGIRYLRFEKVDIAAAPDVYVYLSDRTDGQPGSFTNLGKLKASNGSFNYPIPANLDLAPARSIVVYCRTFNVTITFALLEKS